MGQYQQHYRDYGYDLVVRLDHKPFDQLMFVLVRILLLMAIIFELKLLGFCLMDQFQQHYHGYECGLVERLDHKPFDQLRFILERI